MKRKEFLQHAVLLPLIIGILLCIVFFLFIKSNANLLLPISEGINFAYHDEKGTNKDLADIIDENGYADMNRLSDNDNMGSINFGSESLLIRYNADYSNIAAGASFMPQSNAFGQTGCAYLSMYADNAENLKKSKNITIKSIFGDYGYEYVRQFTADSEYEILSNSPDISKSLIIYYQKSNGAGLSSEYNVLVYKEAS